MTYVFGTHTARQWDRLNVLHVLARQVTHVPSDGTPTLEDDSVLYQAFFLCLSTTAIPNGVLVSHAVSMVCIRLVFRTREGE